MSELSERHIASFVENPYIEKILDKYGKVDPKNETGLLMKNGKLLDSVARYILNILTEIKGPKEFYTFSPLTIGDEVFYGQLPEEGQCLYTFDGIKKKAITAVSGINTPEQIWIPQREMYIPNSNDIDYIKKELEGYPENMQFVNSVSSIDKHGSFYGNYTLKKGHPFFNKEQKIPTLLLEEIATQMSQVALSLSGQKISTSYSSSYIDLNGRDHISPISSDQESIEIYFSGKIQNNPEKISKTKKKGTEITYTIYTKNNAQASGVLILLK